MKKILKTIAFMLAVIVTGTFSLVGCGKTTDDTPKAESMTLEEFQTYQKGTDSSDAATNTISTYSAKYKYSGTTVEGTYNTDDALSFTYVTTGDGAVSLEYVLYGGVVYKYDKLAESNAKTKLEGSDADANDSSYASGKGILVDNVSGCYSMIFGSNGMVPTILGYTELSEGMTITKTVASSTTSICVTTTNTSSSGSVQIVTVVLVYNTQKELTKYSFVMEGTADDFSLTVEATNETISAPTDASSYTVETVSVDESDFEENVYNYWAGGYNSAISNFTNCYFEFKCDNYTLKGYIGLGTDTDDEGNACDRFVIKKYGSASSDIVVNTYYLYKNVLYYTKSNGDKVYESYSSSQINEKEYFELILDYAKGDILEFKNLWVNANSGTAEITKSIFGGETTYNINFQERQAGSYYVDGTVILEIADGVVSGLSVDTIYEEKSSSSSFSETHEFTFTAESTAPAIDYYALTSVYQFSA